MKISKKAVILATVFTTCSTALAERQPERSEIFETIATLAGTPQKARIPAGTIQATHEEYRVSQTTDTNEIDRCIVEEVQAYLDNPNKIQLTNKPQQMRLEQYNTPCSGTAEFTCDSVDGDCSSHTICYSRTCCGSASSGSCPETKLIYRNHNRVMILIHPVIVSGIVTKQALQYQHANNCHHHPPSKTGRQEKSCPSFSVEEPTYLALNEACFGLK